VCIAPDDFVFVADYNNNRVQVLTPRLDFHSIVGAGQLSGPAGVCANADLVVVSECVAHRISVFNRRDGSLHRRFGCDGSDDDGGQLKSPYGLCFMPGDRHVAVAETGNHRVSVFSIDGELIRHVGVGMLDRPFGVACSAFDELVVADSRNRRVVVFSDVGELLMTRGDAGFTGVAVHDSTVYAQDGHGCRCVVWS
jgi:DNA-binding beta-propeller fold protein YncE